MVVEGPTHTRNLPKPLRHTTLLCLLFKNLHAGVPQLMAVPRVALFGSITNRSSTSCGPLCCPAPPCPCTAILPHSSWPRATFTLPPRLSQPGNIYRAQLLVTPKADACEEFWAMNPSGAATNSSCGGLSTGEPYREVKGGCGGGTGRGGALCACIVREGGITLHCKRT